MPKEFIEDSYGYGRLKVIREFGRYVAGLMDEAETGLAKAKHPEEVKYLRGALSSYHLMKKQRTLAKHQAK